MVVKPEDDVSLFSKSIAAKTICPIFPISNVTGDGIDQLKKFLGKVKSRAMTSGCFAKPDAPVEFLIDGIYQVNGVGMVVAGTMISGTVLPNMTLQLGPDKTG